MKLSRASSYALHAAAYMAAQKNNGLAASHVIARDRGIPERFLLMVLKPLVLAQILHSVKGPNGGFRLAKAPGEISLLALIEAVDGPIRGEAPTAQDNPGDRLNKRLVEICGTSADVLRKQLGKVKLTELAGKD